MNRPSRRADSAMLAESYRYCARLANRSARNFSYSFLLLPRDLRRSMHAVYAFFRRTDDIADDPAPLNERQAALKTWREDLVRLLDGGFSDRQAAAWPGSLALLDSVERRGIPSRYLEEVIDGVEMDLTPGRFADFAALRDYCYHVASAVGLTCIHLWGFRSENGRAEELAETCGIALQLTNILRDVREDALQGRVYLPAEDLARFGVSEAELSTDRMTPALRELFAFQADRARRHYEASRPLIHLVEPAGRPVLLTIVGIYEAILDEIARRDYDVMTRRARISAFRKTAIAARAWLGFPPKAKAAAQPQETPGCPVEVGSRRLPA